MRPFFIKNPIKADIHPCLPADACTPLTPDKNSSKQNETLIKVGCILHSDISRRMNRYLVRPSSRKKPGECHNGSRLSDPAGTIRERQMRIAITTLVS